MSAAEDLVWQVAGKLDTAPLTFADLPERARLWLLAWAHSPLQTCEHVGAPLWAVGGYREALCAPCAHRAGLEVLVSHCGRCSAPTGDDESALHAIWPIAPNLLAAVSLCGTCSTDERTETP